jgi:hypothetical protein
MLVLYKSGERGNKDEYIIGKLRILNFSLK